MRIHKRVAAVAAVVCVAAAVLGVGGAAAHRSSGKTYVCAFGKSAGKAGNIYLALGVQPKSIGAYFCQKFNGGFKGKKENIHKQLGTGTAYCKYLYKKHGIKVVLVAFADQAASGKKFCKIYHPSGWTKF